MSISERGRFQNLEHSGGPNGLLEVLKWKWSSKKVPWQPVENTHQPQLPLEIKEKECAATFINHASFLLQFQSLNILIDPVFSETLGPFSKLGIKRVRSPGLTFEQLPKIDLVVISHNHYDHMDLPSIEKVWERDRPTFIVPLNNGKFLRKVGVKGIVELDWWESYGPVTLTPSHHWSSRTLFDRCKSLWGGFLFQEKGWKVLFAGDGGYAGDFKKIYEKFGPLDLSLISIGSYAPRWFMKEHHMCPEEALQAHLDLHSKKSIAYHFGTFQLADEPYHEPQERLKAALQEHGLPPDTFLVPEHGQTFTLSL